MAAAASSPVSAIGRSIPPAPKSIDLQILGLTKVYTNDENGPFAFFEFESARRANENFSVFVLNAAGDFGTYVSLPKVSEVTPLLGRISAYDLFKNDVGPTCAKYGFGLALKKEGICIGEPIKTAEDIIKCVGLAVKTGGAMKSIPVVVISKDELTSEHDGFDSGRFVKSKAKEEKTEKR